MSCFTVTCQRCGETYMTGVVGTTSMGGHICPRRNDLCPCGSGKSWKRCCGYPCPTDKGEVMPQMSDPPVLRQQKEAMFYAQTANELRQLLARIQDHRQRDDWSKLENLVLYASQAASDEANGWQARR